MHSPMLSLAVAQIWMNKIRKRKGTGKRGHTVADTLLLMMFLGLRKLGNIFCGHKLFLNKIKNIFVSATNIPRAGKRGNIFVSAKMCPQQCVLVCQYLKHGAIL